MAVVGSLNVLLGANVAQFNENMKKAAKKVEDFKKKTDEVAGKGALASLKGSFGEESAFGNTFKALRGAGALAGVALAANAMKDLAEGAAQLRKDMKDTSMSASEIVHRSMELVPVLGQINAAGRSIREFFTGEAAELQAMVEAEARRTAQLDKTVNAMRELEAAGKSIADANRSLSQKIALSEVAGPERDALAALYEYQAGYRKLREEQERVVKLGKLTGLDVSAQLAGLQRQHGLLAVIYEDARWAAEKAKAAAQDMRIDEQLEAALGGLEEYADGLKRIGDSLDDFFTFEEEFARSGKAVFEATRTPLEKYQQELEELDALLKAGEISQDTYARAVTKAQEALNGMADVRFADAVGGEMAAMLAAMEDATLRQMAPGAEAGGVAMAQVGHDIGGRIAHAMPGAGEGHDALMLAELREIKRAVAYLKSEIRVGDSR